MPTDDVIDFINRKWVASKAQHLTNIYMSLNKAYAEYDTTILESEIALESDVEVSSDMIMDTVTDVLMSDAIICLAMQGILVSHESSVQTVDAILQLTLVQSEDDMEDLVEIAKTMDSAEAIATLATIVADPGDWLDGYSYEAILHDIEHIDQVCIERFIMIFSGEEVNIPLTPEQLRYIELHPDALIAEMMAPPSVLYTNGSLATYQQIFSGPIEGALDLDELVLMIAGMLVVSNVPSSEYADHIPDLAATYAEPANMAYVLMNLNKILEELRHVPT